MDKQSMSEWVRNNDGHLPCARHRRRLHAEMMRTMVGALTEDAYADLLNLAFVMLGDLEDAERRIWDLEREERDG